MAKFKVGDRVKCIGMKPNYNDKLNIGEIYTISEFTTNDFLQVEENNCKNSYSIEYFELVVPQTELDTLIEIQNKGAEAGFKLLTEFNSQIEVDKELAGIDLNGTNWTPTKLKRKLKPQIAAPILAEGWAVSIVPGEPLRVQIGCRNFEAPKLRDILSQFSKNDKLNSIEEFYASRKGLAQDGHTLSWASVELLLAYLNEILK